jgi:hypothetical protein
MISPQKPKLEKYTRKKKKYDVNSHNHQVHQKNKTFKNPSDEIMIGGDTNVKQMKINTIKTYFNETSFDAFCKTYSLDDEMKKHIKNVIACKMDNAKDDKDDNETWNALYTFDMETPLTEEEFKTYVDCKIEDDKFVGNIYEPACGDGAISKVFINNGFDVYSTDLIYRNFGIGADEVKRLCDRFESFDGRS